MHVRLFGVAKQTSKKILTLAAASVMAFSGLALAAPMFFGQSALADTTNIITSNFNTYNGADANAPTDWTFQNIGDYSTAGYYGAAANSLQLGTGSVATLSLPLTTGESANSVSFWLKGAPYQGILNGSLTLSESSDGGATFTTVATLSTADNTLTTSAQTLSEALDPGTNEIQFSYQKTTGNVALDDVVVSANTSTDLYVNSSTGSDSNVGSSAHPYKTISAAVAAASDEDTVHVAAGDYSSEGTINVSKAVTLVGAQSGVAAANNSTGVERSGSESTLTGFSISSSNVTINGFSVASISITASGSTILSGLDIENNIFSGYSSVGLPTYDAGNIAIQNNYFASPVGSSEAMQIKASSVSGGCNSTQVLNNVFNAATNNGGADINFSCTGSDSATAIVSGNYSTGNSGGSSLAAFSGVDNDIEITNNVAVTSGSTIFFFGNVSGAAYVSGNNFSGGAGNGVSIYGGDAGTSDSSNSGTFTITNNDLSGNNSALKLSAHALTGGGKVVANNNDLSGSTSNVAVNNLSTGSVDATDNYWGASPDFNTLISGSSVTYTPYYINSARTHLNTDLPSTVYVDSSYSASSAGGYEYGWDAFSTIQDAVNMVASGGTIHVAAGFYDSFSVNGKSGITIQGAGAGSTIIAPSSLISTGVGHKYTANMEASVFVNNSTSVTIQGMTIESTSATPGVGGADAIVFWNASTGTIQDSDVTGIYTINGDQTGQGVAVDAGSNQTTSLTLDNVNISGFQKNAVDAVDGNGGSSTGDSVNVDVEGGSIQGAGSINTIAQNGVLAWNKGGGTVTGQVNSASISDLEYSDPSNQDVGIYAYGSATFTSVQNNSLSDVDLYVVNGSGAAIDASTGNSFDGVSPVSATDAQLATIESKLDGATEDSSLKAIYVLPNTLIATTDTGIQAAVDAAAAGDTVYVLPGTYNENVTVNKAITLKGAGSSVVGTVIEPTSGNALSISASGTSSANPLTIEDLRLSSASGNGVYFDTTASHIKLSDIEAVNSVYGIEVHNSAVLNDISLDNVGASNNQIGFRVATTGSVNGLSITNSAFDYNTDEGMYIAANSGSTTNQNDFTNVAVSDTTFNNDGNKGIYAEKLDHATFTNVTVDSSGTTGSYASGFNINEKYGSYSNVTITDSSVTNSGTGDTTNGTGYDIEARDDGSYASNPASLTNVTINGGTVTGNQLGLRFGETGKNNAGPANVTISNVDLAGNIGQAVNNQTQATIDASLNYWGSASPDFSSLATSGVTYSPWYTDSVMSNIASTSNNVTTTSSSAGTASLPSGSTSVSLNSSTKLDVSSGLSGSVGGNITVGGSTQSLSNYSGGSVSGANLTNVSVGGSTVSVGQAVNLQSGSSGQPVTITNTSLSSVTVSVPDSTTILAPSGWDGTITPPTTVTASGTAPSGFAVGSTVVEVGSPNNVLLFDKPVMVELDGITGQVGYKAAGSSAWQLIPACANSDYNTAQDPGFPGACSVTDGTNTKIWTYHFTQFATMNTVSSSQSGGNSSSSSNSSSSTGTGTNSAQSNSNSESGAATSSSGSVKGISTSANAGKTSSLSTKSPAAASLSQPKLAAKEASGGGLRWYWIVLAAIVALSLAATAAYRLAEGTDKTA